MIADWIAFYAARTPLAPALFSHGRTLNYNQLDQQLRCLMFAFARSDVVNRRLVGIAFDDAQMELLALFALEALGVPTLPFMQPCDAGMVAALSQCDLVVAEHAIPGLPCDFALLSAAWYGDAIKARRVAPLSVMRASPSPIVNVFTTSGSTGTVKCIGFDRQALDARVRARLWQYGLSGSSRVLAAMPTSTSGVYFVAQAALRCGASVSFYDLARPEQGIDGSTHVIILPIHLQGLVGLARVEGLVPKGMKIFVVGAKLSSALRARAAAFLAATVVEAYGTTETGWLAFIGDDHLGDVFPDVEVQIVDDHDQPVQTGSAGQIRARSPEMGSGYLDTELSRSRFRDGWFYTNDAGIMHAADRLELLGRIDAMINVGGLKVSAEHLEDILRTHDLAADLGVCSLPDDCGIERLQIVFAGLAVDRETAIERVVAALGANLGPIGLHQIGQLPRTPSGKLERAALNRWVEQQRL